MKTSTLIRKAFEQGIYDVRWKEFIPANELSVGWLRRMIKYPEREKERSLVFFYAIYRGPEMDVEHFCGDILVSEYGKSWFLADEKRKELAEREEQLKMRLEEGKKQCAIKEQERLREMDERAKKEQDQREQEYLEFGNFIRGERK